MESKHGPLLAVVFGKNQQPNNIMFEHGRWQLLLCKWDSSSVLLTHAQAWYKSNHTKKTNLNQRFYHNRRLISQNPWWWMVVRKKPFMLNSKRKSSILIESKQFDLCKIFDGLHRNWLNLNAKYKFYDIAVWRTQLKLWSE